MPVIPCSAKQVSGNIKSDEPKPAATKQCKIMLPLKKNEYSIPSHSNDGGSRDPSAPKAKDEPSAEQEDGQGDAMKEEVQDASPELQKKKGRGRPRKNALNGNQQKGSVDATTDETVTSGSASQKNSEKAEEPGSPAHPVEASDSGLGIEASHSGSGVGTEQIQNTAQPPEEPFQQTNDPPKAGTDEVTNSDPQSEPTKKKGRGRPRKNPTATTDGALTESVQTSASVDSVQASALSDSVQAAAPSDPVRAAPSASTESVPTAASEVDDVENVQSEPPKKKGRGRPPRKNPVIAHTKSPSVEESKESVRQHPSDSTECEPPEKKAKPEEVGCADSVGGSDAVNSSARSLQKEGQGEPHQSPMETAQMVSPAEGSKAPAVVEDALAGASEGGPPEKEAMDGDSSDNHQVKDSSVTGVQSKSPQKRGRGRPRKNVASGTTETAVQPPERDDEEDSADASTEEPKQKRGRPPGPKRGRGRPRKNPAGNSILFYARCQFNWDFFKPFLSLVKQQQTEQFFVFFLHAFRTEK